MSGSSISGLVRGALATGAALCALGVTSAAQSLSTSSALTAEDVQPSATALGLSTGAVFTATNDAQANAVMAFRREASGQLALQGTYLTGGIGSGGGLGNQGGMVLDRSGRHLFVVNAGDDTVSVLRVRTTGLELLDVHDSGGVQPISVTKYGDLVYVLDAGGDGNIAGLRLAPDGTLSDLAGSSRPLSGSGTGPAEIAFTPDGLFLVVSEKGTNTIVTYAVDGAGLPGDPVVSPSAGVTPFGFDFDLRSHLLVSEATGGGAGLSTASSYDILADGSLLPITSALATTQSAACWLVVTPDGRHAYMTNTASGTVTGLSVASGGALGLLQPGGVSAPAGSGPIDAAVSRNGRYMYVLNSGDATIGAYAIRADGSLSMILTVGGLPGSANGLAAL